jgi:TonB family protein
MRGKLTTTLLLLLLAGGTAALRAQDPGPPYRVGGEVSRPQKISGAPPVYTEMARKARVTGVVIVEAVIDQQGNVTDARVLKGLPMGLEQSAVDAVMGWKFEPAMRYGQPVPVYYILTINFQMDESYLGPVFSKFMENNAEFAQHLRNRSFDDAAALLDAWEVERPDDLEIALARVYLLVAQEQFDEAWSSAQALRDSIAESQDVEKLQPLEVEARNLQDLVMRLREKREEPAAKPSPSQPEG